LDGIGNKETTGTYMIKTIVSLKTLEKFIETKWVLLFFSNKYVKYYLFYFNHLILLSYIYLIGKLIT
jgi:hypothetical protein